MQIKQGNETTATLMRNIVGNFLLLAFSIALAVYFIELLLPHDGEPHPLVPRESTHLKAARLQGIPFAEGNRFDVVKDLRIKGIESYPTMSSLNILLSKYKMMIEDKEVLPLAGISKRRTVYRNETGTPIIYDSDKYGFNNPIGSWEIPVEIALVGDSFVHAGSVVYGKDVAASLRDHYKLVNVSYGGNGPLIELGTIKEYVALIKPKTVFWFYFEGNDLSGLETEKSNRILRRYVQEKTFTQGLAKIQDKIDEKWAVFAGPWFGEEKVGIPGNYPTPGKITKVNISADSGCCLFQWQRLAGANNYNLHIRNQAGKDLNKWYSDEKHCTGSSCELKIELDRSY